VKPAKGPDVSKWMQWLMTSHVRRYHRHYGTSGHIWQGRFKSFIVQQDDHLLTAMRYVEGNPVRAGMVASARDWPWSSHRENLGEADRSITDQSPVELPADWSAYVDAPLSGKDLNRFKLSIHKLVPFGSHGTGSL
jgi:putative transposase